jgi:glycosyltransferase involved in cell wall biosynthesis
MKIVMVANKLTWSLGTLARLLKLGMPDAWRFQVLTEQDRISRSERFSDAIRQADIVHWSMHRRFPNDSPLTETGRHVITVHHLEEDETGEWVNSYSRCCKIHVVSRHYQEEMARRGWPVDKIEYIPNPVDDVFFERGDRKLSRPLPAGKSIMRLGFFASAEYEVDRKGIEFLPELSRRLREADVAHEIVVTGLGWENLLKTDPFASASIHYTVVPSYFDMPDLYASLDAYLCLSKIEGGPLVVFEALASGTPVISTAVGAVPEHLCAGGTYFEVAFGDVQGAVEAVQAIHNYPGQAREMCRNGRESIRKVMSLASYHKRFVQFYAEVAGLKQAPQIVPQGWRQALMRRRWRAWDRSYWAKEMWVAGYGGMALRFFVGSFLLDPFGAGVWRAPAGIIRRALSRGKVCGTPFWSSN